MIACGGNFATTFFKHIITKAAIQKLGIQSKEATACH